jgi:hypothetical protein
MNQEQQAPVINLSMDLNVFNLIQQGLDFLPSHATDKKLPASMISNIMNNFIKQAQTQLDAMEAERKAAEEQKKPGAAPNPGAGTDAPADPGKKPKAKKAA